MDFGVIDILLNINFVSYVAIVQFDFFNSVIRLDIQSIVMQTCKTCCKILKTKVLNLMPYCVVKITTKKNLQYLEISIKMRKLDSQLK